MPTSVATAALGDSAGHSSEVLGTRAVADGRFHHVAFARDMQAGELRLYVDGTLDASVSLAGGADGSIQDGDFHPDPFTIGAYQIAGQDARAGFFSGVIDTNSSNTESKRPAAPCLCFKR